MAHRSPHLHAREPHPAPVRSDRVPLAPAGGGPHPLVGAVLGLQRTVGNRAVTALLRRERGPVPAVQRAVSVGDDDNLTSLWVNARNYVRSSYGRRKILAEWVADGTQRDYGAYDELALDLDQEYARLKGHSSAGRGRPAFTDKVQKWLNQTWGGKRHRRHIVMSSVMRNAVYRITDRYRGTVPDLGKEYQALVARAGVVTTDDVDTAESTLVFVLHNNPANLVLDTGPWNSAIGSFAHNVESLAGKTGQAWTLYQQGGAEAVVNGVVSGFHVQLQKQIADFWIQYLKANPPADEHDLQTVLEDMFDNAAVDLLSDQQHPQKDLMPALLNCHAMFVGANSVNELRAASRAFIDLGLGYDPSYADVL